MIDPGGSISIDPPKALRGTAGLGVKGRQRWVMDPASATGAPASDGRRALANRLK